MKVGVIGCGVVGGALAMYLRAFTEAEVLERDPPRGFFGKVATAEIVFICVPADTEEDGRQDLTIVRDCLNYLETREFTGSTVIRSTVLPGTTRRLEKEFKKLTISHMPEFLIARQALRDVVTQDIVFGERGHEGLSPALGRVVKLFPNNKVKLVTVEEAEIAKYTHNVFGALKVTFCNTIFELAKEFHGSYNQIIDAIAPFNLLEKHTDVPGPDGKRGYGGHCFPKDTKAFVQMCDRLGISCETLRGVPVDNDVYRHGILRCVAGGA